MKMIKKQCVLCGKEYEHRDAPSIIRRFCSRSCAVSERNTKRVWKEESKEKLRARVLRDGYNGEKNPNFRDAKKHMECMECGRPFSFYDWENKIGKFCSIPCYRLNVSKNKRRSLSDDEIRLHSNMSRLMRSSLKTDKGGVTWPKILGYTVFDLKKHLESLFEDGMNWGNYGVFGWHIDHVKPMSHFNFTTVKDKGFIDCWALSNLQPMWAVDNWAKNNLKNKNRLLYEPNKNKI